MKALLFLGLFVANFLQPLVAYNETGNFTKSEKKVSKMYSDQLEGDTLTLAEEGTLAFLLSEMTPEKRIKHLTLRGPVNWADLRVLIASEGRLENMESLDLRDVTLVPGGDYYASSSYFGDGTWFTSYNEYYLSDKRYDTHYSDGLSQNAGQHHCHYDYNLAGAFMNTKLKRVVMPGSIDEIGEYTFKNCRQLQTVEMSQLPVFIGVQAFDGCESLRSMADLSNVRKMESSAFNGCQSLFAGSILNLSSLDTIPYQAFYECVAIDSVILSKNLRFIDRQAFSRCGLRTFDIDSSVSIGEDAFSGCSQLATVKLSQNISSLGYGAFANCSKLVNVEISPAIYKMPSDVFSNTPWLDAQPFVNGVKYVGQVAIMTDGSNNITFREGTLGIADYFNGKYYMDGLSLTGDNPYYKCNYKAEQLPQKIKFPSSLLYIGNCAFYGCGNLTEITLPEGVEEIGVFSFGGGVPIAQIQFPASLRKIGTRAFDQSSIVTLTLPATLQEIGSRAFYRNKKLMLLEYNVPRATGEGVFESCTLLERVEMGDEVRELPWSIFSKCSSLLKVNLPDNLEKIGFAAFSGCSSLKEITFGSTVTEIQENAFNSCSSLLTVRSYIREPFTTKAFSWSPTLGQGTLYIPSGTLEKYRTFEQWRYFANIVEMARPEPIDVETTINTANLQGQNLSDNVVDNIYYNLGDDSYDSTDGSIVISKTTDMTKIVNKEPGSADIRENFTGLILKVGKGKGLISINTMTVGNARLMIQTGNNTPTMVSRTEKADIAVDYEVEDDTYIYICAVVSGSNASFRSTRAGSSDEVRIYEISVNPGGNTGINGIRFDGILDSPVYSLSGQRLNALQKGINIVDKKKVIIK